jgi:hypothetical protein
MRRLAVHKQNTKLSQSVTAQAYQKADVVVQSRDISTLKEFSDEIVKVDELLDGEAEPLLGI